MIIWKFKSYLLYKNLYRFSLYLFTVMVICLICSFHFCLILVSCLIFNIFLSLQAAKSDKNSSKSSLILHMVSFIFWNNTDELHAFLEQKMPEGSWKCEKCNNINYPFRTKCNRQNCGAEKPSESTKSPSPEPDEVEQVCHVIHLDCISISCMELLFSLITYVLFTNSMTTSEKDVWLTRLPSFSLLSFSSVIFLKCTSLIVNYLSHGNHWFTIVYCSSEF